MITVDQLLIELNKLGAQPLSKDVPGRDRKILNSLSRQIQFGNFLTENQGKLLVKIFKENLDHLKNSYPAFAEIVQLETWSKPFRVIEQTRKISLSKGVDPQIVIEFTYNKRLKQIVSDLTKNIQGQVLSSTTKSYSIPLTEKNVALVLDAFARHQFEIDEKITDFYREIKDILKSNKNYFNVYNLSNQRQIDLLSAEVTSIDQSNSLKLHDRKFRYQYQIFDKISENSLAEKIANRTSTKVYVNATQTSLTDLIASLFELSRLPALIIFNGHDSKECHQNLKKLASALENNNINDNVGIYFRFDNTAESNKVFNSEVGTLKYNSLLNSQTKIAGIANNKLPKFLIKSQWYPKTVISFSNHFKNNKTSVYCDAVDLIVYYNDRPPLEGTVNAIV